MSEEKKNKYILKSMINISDFVVGNTDQINQEYLEKLNLYGGKIPSQDLILNSYASVLDHPIKNKILNNLLHLLVSCFDHMDNVSDELIDLFAGIYVDTAMALFLTGCDQGKVDSNTLKLFMEMVNTKFASKLNKNYDFPLSKKVIKTNPVVATIKLLNRNNNKNKKYLSVLGNLISKTENNELNLQLGGLYENAKVLSSIPVVAKFNDILLDIYSNQQLGGSSQQKKQGTSQPVQGNINTSNSSSLSQPQKPVQEKSQPVQGNINTSNSSSSTKPLQNTQTQVVQNTSSSSSRSVSPNISKSQESKISAEENKEINEKIYKVIGNIDYNKSISILNKYIKHSYKYE
jgi:hypothetical protein